MPVPTTLKPYSNELLTRGGEFWIASARLLILAMATAEAIAWGYMGSLMSQGHRWIAAGVAALFVFTLIWIIDATFMTLDLARGRYERALGGSTTDAAKERLKLVGGVVARLAIVTASLYITAPFLAQAIFARDVEGEMVRRNASMVASTRQELERPFAARLEELRAQQARLEDERVREAAGVGPSRRYGRGPALETIERQLEAKLVEIGALDAARRDALARFDALSRTELEAQHGIRFLAPGVRSSAALLDQMLADPQFRRTELAVRAFLAFLFLGLLILKMFQPRSIAVYFSEQLHSLYDEYRKGLFDDYLPEAERASAGGSIDPLRFEEWCRTSYSVIRGEEESRRASSREMRAHQRLVEQWHQLEAEAQRELEPLRSRREAVLGEIEQLERERHAARVSASAAAADLEKAERAYESMLRHVEAATMDGATFEQAMRARQELEERRRSLWVEVRNGEAAVEALDKRLEGWRGDAAALAEEIATRRAVAAEAQKRIVRERMRLAEAVAGPRSRWPADAA